LNHYKNDELKIYSIYGFPGRLPGPSVCGCVVDEPGFNHLSLLNQWQLPLRFNALFTPLVTSAKANEPYLAAPQKSPIDVQNPPNAYACLLTRVASGSTESSASETQHLSEVGKMIMQTIKASVVKFAKDEDGLTIVEYAVAGGLITVAVAAMFTLLGGAVNTRITALCAAVKGAPC
jgi:pilus assembly protein Flp/PilA